MKSFRYKFTPLTWVLIALVLIISLAGVGFNIYNLASSKEMLAINMVSLIIILIINLALAIFTFSVMAFSRYKIKNGVLYTCFGLIFTKIKIEQITELTHFRKSDKLVAYFNADRYTVIVISPEHYDDFIREIRAVNAKIAFDIEEQES